MFMKLGNGKYVFNLLHAELNPICHLLALLGSHHIFHVSRIRVKFRQNKLYSDLRKLSYNEYRDLYPEDKTPSK